MASIFNDIALFKKRNNPQTRIDCLISVDTVVDGDITFSGGLRVDGTVKGNIAVHESGGGTLIISQQAKVDGLVTVSHAIVDGEIQGGIIAKEFLQLESHARVSGDVTYSTLEMHHGAVVSGRLSHVTEPEKQDF